MYEHMHTSIRESKHWLTCRPSFGFQSTFRTHGPDPNISVSPKLCATRASHQSNSMVTGKPKCKVVSILSAAKHICWNYSRKEACAGVGIKSNDCNCRFGLSTKLSGAMSQQSQSQSQTRHPHAKYVHVCIYVSIRKLKHWLTCRDVVHIFGFQEPCMTRGMGPRNCA